ncbi:hypothetical protein KAX14_03305, partial [Candidatus Bipolaricaulota bacterium]|nr:hypothetical protein [Candidatus Bipolaricaulota bacterium]
MFFRSDLYRIPPREQLERSRCNLLCIALHEFAKRPTYSNCPSTGSFVQHHGRAATVVVPYL